MMLFLIMLSLLLLLLLLPPPMMTETVVTCINSIRSISFAQVVLLDALIVGQYNNRHS